MNVLIVDDEETILLGLAAQLKELPISGIDRVHCALNASEALNLLSSTPVDLVITDIHMPGIDGLSLTGTIRHRHPDIPVVILTGYNDRAYLQQAIRLKAEDYLFKPVKPADLAQLFERLGERRARDRKTSRFIDIERFESLPFPYKAVMACDLDEGSADRHSQLGGDEMILWMYRQVIREAAEPLEDIYFISPGSALDSCNLLIAAGADTAEEAIGRLERLALSIGEFWSSSIRLGISFGLSSGHGRSVPFSEPRKEACAALLYRLGFGSGLHGFVPPAGPIAKSSRSELQTAIELADSGALLAELKRELARVLDCAPDSRMLAAEDLLQFLYAHLAQCYPSQSLPLFQRAAALTERLVWARTEEQFSQLFMLEMNEWLGSVIPEHSEYGIVALAKSVIQSRFSEPLNIGEVAAAVYVSPSHLSRLFRARTNTTFLEYLTNVRVEEAKKRLTDPRAKVYDIAVQVGYSDWKHFSRVFKEATGCHPSDYRTRTMGIHSTENET
ncbi:response regulator transcription factor [Cohnella hongkongensis]|uniref:Response regulator n=1 Tax=Cohnella hongkongensis TaxID=178337 RepID=A0ABV9FHW5_9BACL